MRYSDTKRRERFALARAFGTSELTKAEYCRRHGLSTNSLDHWIREAAKQDSETIEGAFYEIQVAADAPTAFQARQPDLEVDLPLGVKLRFFGTITAR